jgi:hypothetical protein
LLGVFFHKHYSSFEILNVPLSSCYCGRYAAGMLVVQEVTKRLSLNDAALEEDQASRL